MRKHILRGLMLGSVLMVPACQKASNVTGSSPAKTNPAVSKSSEPMQNDAKTHEVSKPAIPDTSTDSNGASKPSGDLKK